MRLSFELIDIPRVDRRGCCLSTVQIFNLIFGSNTSLVLVNLIQLLFRSGFSLDSA